ncbi:MAG TPA: hypothetical protein DDZ04_02805, partial [Parabacteroides sp.]|nr:hypothetical protein [Parabacteroides sp.]
MGTQKETVTHFRKGNYHRCRGRRESIGTGGRHGCFCPLCRSRRCGRHSIIT